MLEDFDLNEKPAKKRRSSKEKLTEDLIVKAAEAALEDEEFQQFEDINLEQELMDNYTMAKRLRNTVSTDFETPANQKAQVFNTMTSILTQLVRLKTVVYNSERLRLAEQALLEALEDFPLELKIKFIAAYEERGIRLGLR